MKHLHKVYQIPDANIYNGQEFNDYRTTTVIEKYDTNVASRVPLQANGRQ